MANLIQDDEDESKKEGVQYYRALLFYRDKLKVEVLKQSQNIIKILKENIFLPSVDLDVESKTFFHKLAADYYRYIAECVEFILLDKTRKAALLHYQLAEEASLSGKGLKPYSAVKLGLTLNHSVFIHEVMKNTKKAIEIA